MRKLNELRNQRNAPYDEVLKYSGVVMFHQIYHGTLVESKVLLETSWPQRDRGHKMKTVES